MEQQDKTIGILGLRIKGGVTLTKVRHGFAYYRVFISPDSGDNRSIEIIDNRVEVVEKAEKVIKIASGLGRGKKSDETREKITAERDKALTDFYEAINGPSVVTVEQQSTTRGSRYQTLLVNDPRGNKPNGLLVAVRAQGGQYLRSGFSAIWPIFSADHSSSLHFVVVRDGDAHLAMFSDETAQFVTVSKTGVVKITDFVPKQTKKPVKKATRTKTPATKKTK